MRTVSSTAAKLSTVLIVSAFFTACGGGGSDTSSPETSAERASSLAATNSVLAVKPRAFEHSTDHEELRSALSAAGIQADQGTCFKPNTDGSNLVVGCLAADVSSPILPQADFCSPWLDAYAIPASSAATVKALGFQVVDLGPSWKEIPCPSKN